MCCLLMPSWKPRRDAQPFAWPICSSFENGWIVIWPRVRAWTMCKENYASCVTINTPHSGTNERVRRLAMCSFYALVQNKWLADWLNFLLTPLDERRIYCYIMPSKVPDAQAPEARCQDSGTGPQRNPQPASRGDHRSTLPEQPLLRPARSSASPLRDAAPASHRRSVDCRDDAPLRCFTSDLLPCTDGFHREGP